MAKQEKLNQESKVIIKKSQMGENLSGFDLRESHLPVDINDHSIFLHDPLLVRDFCLHFRKDEDEEIGQINLMKQSFTHRN